MIRQEGPPRLRGRTCPSCQQTRHGAFRDVDAEGPQLAVNPGRSPQRIRRGHLTDEGADVPTDRRTAVRARCCASDPSPAEPRAMPRTTVSGRTITIAVRQFVQMRRKAIQNRRSGASKRGRVFARFIAISCCRSARFSRTSSRCPRRPNASARPTTINSLEHVPIAAGADAESTRTSSGEGQKSRPPRRRVRDCSRTDSRYLSGCGGRSVRLKPCVCRRTRRRPAVAREGR